MFLTIPIVKDIAAQYWISSLKSFEIHVEPLAANTNISSLCCLIQCQQIVVKLHAKYFFSSKNSYMYCATKYTVRQGWHGLTRISAVNKFAQLSRRPIKNGYFNF